MQIIHSITAMQRQAETWRRQGCTIGLVPTMGALHEGHLSLVQIARQHARKVVVSIFVNPTQFGPHEDFNRYPRDLGRDRRRLLRQGLCDAVFTPATAAMYPEQAGTAVDEPGLSQGLCGRFRPGHFRGVTTVVAKLFNIVKPHCAVFGQKDYQQAAVIQRMVRDLNFDLNVLVAPIVREPDGLAMSSRNQYLSPDERRAAPAIHQALLLGKELIEKKRQRDARAVLAEVRRRITAGRRLKIQYLELADAVTLAPVKKARGKLVLATAVYAGATRLIDNAIIKAG
jgi:pantoate--beta-alanine ligase